MSDGTMRGVACDEVVVQGITRLDRELLDAQSPVGSRCRPAACSRFWPSTSGSCSPESFIAGPFASKRGRLIGSVLVLVLYNLSDPQTADALRYDIRWKVACRRSLTATSFDPSTLVYWRKRIAASQHPDRVFDAVAKMIADTGVLRGKRKQCGFDGVRRRGGHPGHGDPVGGGDAQGGAVRAPAWSR